MGAIKVIGMIIYAMVCVAIIILALMQAKDSSGASSAVMGGSDGEKSFYEKNIGRTKEGKMRRWTIILAIVFVVLTIGFGIFLEINK